MKQKKSKIVALEQKKSKSFEPVETKSKKKISFGKIVQKTVEILKKPFANQDKPEKVEVDSDSKFKRKRKAKKEKQQQSICSRPKSKRKKETITVDYPKTSLKNLEKDHKILNQEKQHQKPIKENIEARIEIGSYQDEDQLEEAKEKQKEASSQISTEVNGFFYTNDKFINRFEDPDILQYLKSYYPLFMKDPSDFLTQKKQILDMLQNVAFMNQFLSYYDMNIYEFFKFLFRLEPDLFKGSFLKRIQKAMRYKQYAIKAKRCSFLERRKTRLKNLKQHTINQEKL